MNICFIGTGYVGLVSGVLFSDFGHKVICVDNDRIKIDKLNKGIIPIFEPGLKELVEKNRKKERLNFSSNYSSVGRSQIVFLALRKQMHNHILKLHKL